MTPWLSQAIGRSASTHFVLACFTDGLGGPQSAPTLTSPRFTPTVGHGTDTLAQHGGHQPGDRHVVGVGPDPDQDRAAPSDRLEDGSKATYRVSAEHLAAFAARYSKILDARDVGED